MAQVCMVDSGMKSVVLIDCVIEVSGCIMKHTKLCPLIQSNATKLTELYMDSDPKQNGNRTKDFLKAKKWDIFLDQTTKTFPYI